MFLSLQRAVRPFFYQTKFEEVDPLETIEVTRRLEAIETFEGQCRDEYKEEVTLPSTIWFHNPINYIKFYMHVSTFLYPVLSLCKLPHLFRQPNNMFRKTYMYIHRRMKV